MIDGHYTKAIVDLGILGNFIALYYIRKYNLPIRRHRNPY